jgi:D-alanyl-lipoteichoic acid acyltransferase DltB (MBOAT superfamily)
MLFNSFEFLFAFLPVTLVVVFGLRRFGAFLAAEVAIIVGSLIFFMWWDWRFVGLLLFSAVFNWLCGTRASQPSGRNWLILAVVTDLAILAGFKYGLFLRDAMTLHLSDKSSAYVWLLPLGISFWTFEQIIYVVDCYRGVQRPLPFRDYLFFVTFFPRLIAGPIVRPHDFLISYQKWREAITPDMIAAGISLVAIGLFKKVCLSDQIGPIISPIYAAAELGALPSHWDAAVAAVGFGLQIYFDFSGYSDIAIGLALMLGIRLPQNFTSPYKSASIIEFWRSWHISLSTFLRDYLYIPLGGNRNGRFHEMANIAITMALGGLWHGAGINFIIWGLLHGAYVNAAHLMRRLPIPRWLGWACTMYAVCVAWVFFRADSFGGAKLIVWALLPTRNPVAPTVLEPFKLALLGYGIVHCLLLPNSVTLFHKYILTPEKGFAWRPNLTWAVLCAILFSLAVWMMLGGHREFIYFQF